MAAANHPAPNSVAFPHYYLVLQSHTYYPDEVFKEVHRAFLMLFPIVLYILN